MPYRSQTSIERPAALGRQRGARGVLEVRDRVDQLRHPPRGAGLGERLDDHAVVVHRDRQHLHVVQAQLQEGAVVGRALDRDAGHRAEQRLEEEHEALQRPVGDEDLVGGGAVLGGQQLAQRRIALAGSVGEDPRPRRRRGRRGYRRRSDHRREPRDTEPRVQRRSTSPRGRSLADARARSLGARLLPRRRRGGVPPDRLGTRDAEVADAEGLGRERACPCRARRAIRSTARARASSATGSGWSAGSPNGSS